MTAGPPLFSVEGMSAGYDDRPIVTDASLHVSRGEIVTIIGHNGAGKSTLLRAVFNLVPWRRGVIQLGDRDLLRLTPEQLLGAGVAYVPQHRSVFPKLTVAENLRMGGYSVRNAQLLASRIAAVEQLFPMLVDRRTELAGMLSGGEQRMLEIARALLVDPQLVMLDEPSIGLAPRVVDAVFYVVGRLKAAGKAVLMVEQNVKKALRVSDRGYVMELGRIRLEDRADRLLDDNRVDRLYFGP